ncbi:MAG: DUF5017 domain-containing protein [Prolixibacteraceae bacterium]|jgi:hypothetical protein|nr:DUF5017 domain-containing protein [Prolixibacteraceae bacterium]
MKIKIFNLVIGLIVITGCSMELEVDEPTLDVSVESTTVQVGQEILFNFAGQADNIYFYSGELLKDYSFKDGRIIQVADSGAVVSFTSAVSGGTQENQLSVLYSTNFNGNYNDLASVKAATWVDITSNFKLGTSATFLASGPFDISELIVAGKPIYFAFKYTNRPQIENGWARTWMIQNFTVLSKAKLGTTNLTVYSQLYAGFRIVDENPENAPARSVITTSRVTLLGNIYKDPADPIYDPENPIYDPENPIYDPESPDYNPDAELPVFVPYDYNSPYNDPLSENWAVSAPIHIDKIDLGPDKATAIKSKETQSEGYSYTYSAPGTYQAYFVASNNSIDYSKQIVRKFEITVIE